MKMVFQGKAVLCFCWIQHCIFTGVEMTSPCSSGQLYYPTREICYWLVSSMENFNDGESACTSGGGHLANIPDQASLNFIIQEYGTVLESYAERFLGYWIGVTDSASEGEFRTMNGEPQTWTFWKNGDPNDNDIPPQDCVRMFPQETPAYAWQDRSCTETAFAFCSKNLAAETTTSLEDITTTTELPTSDATTTQSTRTVPTTTTEPTTSDVTTTQSTTTTVSTTTTEPTTSDVTTTQSTTTTVSTTTTEPTTPQHTTTQSTTTTTEIPTTEEQTETTPEHSSIFPTTNTRNTRTGYTTEVQTTSFVSTPVDAGSTTDDKLSTHFYWKGTSKDVTKSTTDQISSTSMSEPPVEVTTNPVCKGSGTTSTKCCSDSKCNPELSNLTCYCTCSPHLSADDPILIKKIQQLVDELTIPKKNTSVNRRKYISVVDNRPSARGLGYFGASILAAVIACIVLMDLSTVFRNIQHVTLQARRESTCNQTNWAIKIES